MTTLFVNACVRGDLSRTLKLCCEYLAGKSDVVEVDLGKMGLKPLDAETVAYRSQLNLNRQFDDPIFDLSFQFAKADDIVIGAPYWDLSFPAVLKIYIERVSVDGITFHYNESCEYEGLSKARSITYIATCGGFVTGADFGYEYICGIAHMFGIPEVRYVLAEGLDMPGADIEACLDKARAQMAKL